MKTHSFTVTIPAEEFRRLAAWAHDRNIPPENVASLWIANEIRRKTPRLPPPASDTEQPYLFEGTTDQRTHYDGGL